MKKIIIMAVIIFTAATVFAVQNEKKEIGKHSKGEKDSLEKVSQVKPYGKVVTENAVIQKGLINVIRVGDRYYFELVPASLNKDMLWVTRISKGAANIPDYPGDEITRTVVRFEKGPHDKLFLRKALFIDYAADTTALMHQAVVRTNLMPIIEAFPIVAYHIELQSVLIDVTDFIGSDNQLFSLDGYQKNKVNLTSLEKDKSYISEISSFTKNVEILAVKTYGFARKADGFTINSSTTFELNTSIIELPDQPMRQRFEDMRVGYFASAQRDYDANRNGIKERAYIHRWNLRPRQEDVEKYNRGQLVEPEKQIVFYIDPATPKQWVPYLIQGVNDWNQAFEKAGFKNAIVGKVAPTKEEDPEWNLYDARHSAIIYKASDTKNAAGYSISDPRTGEILESHVSWYHNIIQLIHDQYMVSCAAVDPLARNAVFPDTLMGKLIRYAISHEIGHALGLRHNMGASSTVPTDSLRNKKWLHNNGLCPSVMDYARFNYVAQPEDDIPENDLIARIGAYDKWAIEWGYKWLPQFQSPEDEAIYLQKYATERLKDKRLWYGSEESLDPRSQANSLGDDVIKSSRYGIASLKRMLPQLDQWTRQSGRGYELLSQNYDLVRNKYFDYVKFVTDFIGGTYETISLPGENRNVYRPVSYAYQKKAMQFLSEQQFKQPTWLLDTTILARTGQTASGILGELNHNILGELLSSSFKLGCLYARNQLSFNVKTYTALELLEDIKKDVWTELYSKEAIAPFRRNQQETYLKETVAFLADDRKAWSGLIQLPISGFTPLYSNDVSEMQIGQLLDIQKMIRKNIPLVKDQATRYHLIYCDNQINRLWNTGKALKTGKR
ncbi:zinc-dependent metalloprotease [Mucilaginibacter sp. Mucisp84]|uniref:zinc-dependent metalloprotease n=1 Tax=Mucilaginibacter sp. Mucisp84 TaxID=3243058 RepID=UPI0039A6A8EB